MNKILNIASILNKKRLAQALNSDEIGFIIKSIGTKDISDAQIAAFTMGVAINGMDYSETASLTKSMTKSGMVLDLGSSYSIDKHSSGGVGDCISLALVPVLVALLNNLSDSVPGLNKVKIPMLSGRGLGHTGGTLDKLESVKGYEVAINPGQLIRLMNNTDKDNNPMANGAIVGQTSSLAPADRKIYSIRDTTGTVESNALITASILSKKLAAGVDNLVMDIKCGNGAFMPDVNTAKCLADYLKKTADHLDLKLSIVISDMNQPLAPVAGNSLEIEFIIDYLLDNVEGNRVKRFNKVLVNLIKLMLTNISGNDRLRKIDAKLAADLDYAGEALSERYSIDQDRLNNTDEGDAILALDIYKVIEDGSAAEYFLHMLQAQGMMFNDLVELKHSLAHHSVKYKEDVIIDKRGIIDQIDCRRLGMVVVNLGGGRLKPGDSIDHAVGLGDIKQLGDIVDNDKVCTVYANNQSTLAAAVDEVKKSFSIDEEEFDRDNIIMVSDNIIEVIN